MAIALRHEYNVDSIISNNADRLTYPGAVHEKIALSRRRSEAIGEQQNLELPIQQTSTQLDLPGQIKPVWIGNPDDGVRKPSFQPLQEWEGYVLDIGTNTFTARLVDRTAGQKFEEEIGEFPISDLSEDDKNLLRSGAVFRWVIGYERTVGGTKRRGSQLVFRRMPAWSKRELDNAARRADELLEGIDWE